jgi:HlyD family secretion protein
MGSGSRFWDCERVCNGLCRQRAEICGGTAIAEREGMDIARPNGKKRKTRRALTAAVVIVGVLSCATAAFSRLGKFAPKIGRAALWVDTVQRGRFVREVRGSGTLVPKRSQLIVADSDGTVVRRVADPGAILKAGDPIVHLANPELEQQVGEAQLALQAAEADLLDLTTNLRSQALGQASSLAVVRGELQRAKTELVANEKLAADGSVAELVLVQSRARAKELVGRSSIERKRLAMAYRSVKNQENAQKARIAQLRTQVQLKRARLAKLVVTTPIDGVMQQVDVQLGQRLAAGAVIGKIADPGELRAEIKVAETQANDVRPGQRVAIDTHNGIIAGPVLRVDPSALNGSVTVVVGLEGKLPEGARPDLNVEGAITVEVVDNVTYVGRPALADKGATLGLFKLAGANSAKRVSVRLGRTSSSLVEVVDGLRAGDQVILSDMSAWARHESLRLQ